MLKSSVDLNNVKSVPIVCPILGYNRNKYSDDDASQCQMSGYIRPFRDAPSASNEIRFAYSRLVPAFQTLFLDVKLRTDEATDLKMRISPNSIYMTHPTPYQNVGVQNFFGSDDAIAFTKKLKGDGTDYWTIPHGATGLSLRGIDIKEIVGLDVDFFPIMFMFDRDPVDASFHIDRLKCYGTLPIGEGYA